jgi:L-cysteine:1D-myo-inositol 2-amino-2-deoxy-alpha-D-glucopyranoside ligase
MHVGMVRLDGEKMSKSLGNLVFAGELLKEHDASAIRLALMSQHYRGSYEWTAEMMDDAETRLALWRSAGAGDAGLEAARERLDDDLDTPGVVKALDAEARAGGGVSRAASLLGIVL